VTTEAS
jgi:hypothetical protein